MLAPSLSSRSIELAQMPGAHKDLPDAASRRCRGCCVQLPTLRPRNVQVLAAVLSLSAAVLLSLSVLAATMLVTLTPVYKEIECRTSNQLAVPKIDTNATGYMVDVQQVLSCRNSNAYDLHVHESRPGRVLMLPEQKVLGSVSVEPFDMQVGGVGEMRATMHLFLENQTVTDIVNEGHAKVLIELNMEGHVTLGLVMARISPSFKKAAACGFEMDPLNQKIGPLVCDTSEKTVMESILPMGDGEILPVRFGVEKTELQHYQNLVGWAFGSLLAVCMAIALALLVTAVILIRRTPAAVSQEAAKGDPEAEFAAVAV